MERYSLGVNQQFMLKADLRFFKNQRYVGGHASLVQSKVVIIIHSFHPL